MRRIPVALLIPALWSGCTCSDVTIVPPRVPQGGRAVAIAVTQNNAKRLIVATESGGLFRTFDGGVSFHHLSGFPTFAPVDVAIASLAPETVIATARDDFRRPSGGGIWRSTDGGGSWRRPTGWPPAPGVGCPNRPEARNISHMPLTRTFYVATDCGVAVSTDDGATFSFGVLDASLPPRLDSLQNRVRSVLVLNRTTGVAANDTLLYFLRGGQWQRSLAGGPTAGGVFAIHAMASPWWATGSVFYHAGRDGRLWFSADAGANWEQMEAPPQGNREHFVRVGRGLDGDPTHIDVYYGDGFALHRQAVTTAVPGGSNAWTQPDAMDHRDPSDVAFDPGLEHPILLATDGGVHRTLDDGRTWTLTGSNFGGFVALQIGEVTGRVVGGSKPHMDVYYSTQDNDIKGSDDGGQTWKGSICCEGAFLRANSADPARVDDDVTGRSCGGCRNFVVPPHLGQQNPPPSFKNAPDGNPANKANPPFQTLGSTYLQEVPNPGGTPPSFDWFLTPDRGASWAPAFSLTRAGFGIVQFAGALANPVAYTGVKKGGFGLPLQGLMRIQNVTGQPSVRRADSLGIGSLGTLSTGQATYVVFGVDPSAPDHLIAPDILDGRMKASANGGTSWYPLPQLTSAVLDSAKFFPMRGASTFVTTIAWDPTNSCHILVGTMQNGVIRSVDGGLTWRRVAGSPSATWITSFFFPSTGAIWMSSYGRGLWTLSVDRRRPTGGRCQFPRPPGPVAFPDTGVVVVFAGGPPRPFAGLRDTAMCATCSLVAVRNGWITDLVVQRDSVREIAMLNGGIVQLDRAGREIPLTVPNAYRDSNGATIARMAGRALTPLRRVRGVILDGARLVALVLGPGDLQLPAGRVPALHVAAAGSSRIPSVVESGDSVSVYGYGFVPGRAALGVDVSFDGRVVARGVAVDGDGRFALTLPLNRPRGELEVTVEQRDGLRVTKERATITVVGRER